MDRLQGIVDQMLVGKDVLVVRLDPEMYDDLMMDEYDLGYDVWVWSDLLGMGEDEMCEMVLEREGGKLVVLLEEGLYKDLLELRSRVDVLLGLRGLKVGYVRVDKEGYEEVK